MDKDYFLKKWEESDGFGGKYVERCNVDSKDRREIFEKLIKELGIKSILEVGCNKGHNLEALDTSVDSDIFGIEPNSALCKVPHIIKGNAYELPWEPNVFEMVFTSGVLIHIPEYNLATALSEMNRVASKYVMFIEYYSDKTEGKEYRDFGGKEGVWSRPYGEIYKKQFPDNELVKTGKISDLGDDGWGFTDCNYWIYKKP